MTFCRSARGNAVYVHFTPAGFLKSTGAKGIDYVGIWTSYTF